MPVVKLEAFRALEAAIKAEVPDVETVVVQRPANKTECLPNLTIIPVRFRYEAYQEHLHFEPDTTKAVLNVGCHRGTVQLRLVASTLEKRADVEERVLDVFLRTEGHPGVLLTPVTACPALGEFLAAWELEEDEWDNAKAFDNRYESVIVLTGLIPALVTRAGVYRVEQLHLGISSDMDRVFTPATFAEATVVSINPNGTFTPVA